MLTTCAVLLAQAAAAVPLALAPGQEALDRAHQQDFPKAGWAVVHAPVSAQPQLGGQLLEVLGVGTAVQVAGLGAEVVRRDPRRGADDVFAVPVDVMHRRVAGFVLARQIAVVETVLGRCGSGALVFATVTGRSMVPGVKGMVLEVSVWSRAEGAAPELVLDGPNVAPMLRSVSGAAGRVAVALGGRVVVLDATGRPIWRSPEGQRWLLDRAAEKGFVVRDRRNRAHTVGG